MTEFTIDSRPTWMARVREWIERRFPSLRILRRSDPYIGQQLSINGHLYVITKYDRDSDTFTYKEPPD